MTGSTGAAEPFGLTLLMPASFVRLSSRALMASNVAAVGLSSAVIHWARLTK